MYDEKTYIKPLPFTHTHAHTRMPNSILTITECKNFILTNKNVCDGSSHLVLRNSDCLISWPAR